MRHFTSFINLDAMYNHLNRMYRNQELGYSVTMGGVENIFNTKVPPQYRNGYQYAWFLPCYIGALVASIRYVYNIVAFLAYWAFSNFTNLFYFKRSRLELKARPGRLITSSWKNAWCPDPVLMAMLLWNLGMDILFLVPRTAMNVWALLVDKLFQALDICLQLMIFWTSPGLLYSDYKYTHVGLFLRYIAFLSSTTIAYALWLNNFGMLGALNFGPALISPPAVMLGVISSAILLALPIVEPMVVTIYRMMNYLWTGDRYSANDLMSDVASDFQQLTSGRRKFELMSSRIWVLAVVVFLLIYPVSITFTGLCMMSVIFQGSLELKRAKTPVIYEVFGLSFAAASWSVVPFPVSMALLLASPLVWNTLNDIYELVRSHTQNTFSLCVLFLTTIIRVVPSAISMIIREMCQMPSVCYKAMTAKSGEDLGRDQQNEVRYSSLHQRHPEDDNSLDHRRDADKSSLIRDREESVDSKLDRQ